MAKEITSLCSADDSDDSDGLLDAERDTLPSASERTETEPLDSELPADVFHLSRRRSAVTRDVSGVDARREPVIHNAFFIPGKVPSLNELLDAKSKNQPMIRSLIMRHLPQKGKQGGARY